MKKNNTTKQAITLAATAVFFVCLFCLTACKKETQTTATHPYAGTYTVQNQMNGYYLQYIFNGTYHGMDVAGADSIQFIAGPAAGQYYVVSKKNIDKYLDTDNQCCTFVRVNDFTNSSNQLFTVEPIYEGATRYYIKSVKNPALYLSSFKQLGVYSSTFFNVYNATDNGPTTLAQIWILNKL